MAKHTKRVSLGPQPPEAKATPLLQPPKATSEPQPTTPAAEGLDVTLDAWEQAQPPPGIETHPLFWFVLGALTVGIIVLLGLLLMGTGATPASGSKPGVQPPTSTAVAPAVRPATPTQVAPAAQPNFDATVTAYVEAAQSVPRITVQEAKQKLDAGTILLVDVRSKQSYDAGHIKGAINIPQFETETRLSEFPRDKEIVLYCS